MSKTYTKSVPPSGCSWVVECYYPAFGTKSSTVSSLRTAKQMAVRCVRGGATRSKARKLACGTLTCSKLSGGKTRCKTGREV